ncbi:MAG: toxin-antitoxin system HicB family antitoxin [Microthrixaceae bacterium]
MGRPRVSSERRVATAVRLPESIHRRLHLAAEDRAVSANLIITKAVDEYLERLPSADTALTLTRSRVTQGEVS